MMPWGDVLPWLPPFLVEEEVPGDMLAWEETLSTVCVALPASSHSTMPEDHHLEKRGPTTDRGYLPLPVGLHNCLTLSSSLK